MVLFVSIFNILKSREESNSFWLNIVTIISRIYTSHYFILNFISFLSAVSSQEKFETVSDSSWLLVIITLLLIWFYIKSMCIVLPVFTSRSVSLLACRISLLISKEEVEILKLCSLKIFWINFHSTFCGYTCIFRYHLLSSSLENVRRPCIVFYNMPHHYSEKLLDPIKP
jgi:hypothetical protein